MSQTEGISFNRSKIPHGGWFKAWDVLAPFVVNVIGVVGARSPKVKAAIRGRKDGLKTWRIGERNSNPVVLIHVASAGEFEGARPVVDRLISTGKVNVAVSFSSPSAQPVVEATEGLWACGYLPLDYLLEQLRFLAALEPKVVLIFKHDFWPNMIRAASALGIPVGLINANFHSKTKRHYPIAASFHRSFMKYLSFVWTVSEDDSGRVNGLLGIGTELKAGGDTRYDRVLTRAMLGKVQFAGLKRQLDSTRVIVAGSTWPPGEDIIWEAFAKLREAEPRLKLVLAPHEPTAEAIARNREKARKYQLPMRLYSEIGNEVVNEPVLLVDKIGILAGLYSVGWAAYVGGGFGRGVHSVIEPAAHQLPVCFGQNHHVSHEASLLIAQKGGFVVRTTEDLIALWGGWLGDETLYQSSASAAYQVVKDKAGVTERLMGKLSEYIEL